jgi:uncharacterized protein YciI
MSHFVLEYRYADQDARARVRPDHLAYMNRLHEQGRVVLAGAMADGLGAMVVIRADDEEAARQVVREDPYTAAGVSADATLREWNVVVPAP